MGICPTRTGIGGVGGRHWTHRSGNRGPSCGSRAVLSNGFRDASEQRSGAAGGGDAAGRTRADRAHAPRRTEPGNAVRTGSAPSRGLRSDSNGCAELRADATGRGGAARARASRCSDPTGAEPHEHDQSGSKHSCWYGPDDQGPCCGDCGPDDNDRQLGGRTQQPEQHIHTLRHLGRDLGIMWDNGQTGANDQVLIAFGDTFGDCSVSGQQWRSNTLFRSADRNLSDGVSVPDPAFRQRLRRLAGPVRDSTGIELLKTDHRQSQSRPNRSDHHPDRWNLGGDNTVRQFYVGQAVGQSGPMDHELLGNRGFHRQRRKLDRQPWNRSVRASFSAYPASGSTGATRIFSRGRSSDRDGYLYSYGTPSGRSGSAYVSRVPENAVLDLSQYEYWSQPWWNFFGAGSWVANSPWAATPVISAPVSEMSVQYNDYLNKYIVLYTDGSNSVVMRTADNPQGPWSAAQTLVTSTQLPGGIYAPFIHPWSTGHDLYFNLSLWSAYSVMLMHTTLP